MTTNLKLQKLKESFAQTLPTKIDHLKNIWQELKANPDSTSITAFYERIMNINESASSFGFIAVAKKMQELSVYMKEQELEDYLTDQDIAKITELIISISILSHQEKDQWESGSSDSELMVSSFKILIVDDDLTIANYYSFTLQEVGMTTLIVTDPVKIEDCIFDFQPDLILLDFYIPNCDTIELVKKLRQNQLFVTLPIIFITADDSIDNKLRAFHVGADDFINKPIHPDYLISIINSRIARLKSLQKAIGSLPPKQTKPKVANIEKKTVHLAKDILLDTIKKGVHKEQSTQKVSSESYMPSPFESSILDKILCKQLLEYNVIPIKNLQEINNEQKQLQREEKNVSIYNLAIKYKLASKEVLDNLIHLKTPQGISVIPNYEAQKIIAEGGMGLVYKGKNKVTNEKVAIKIYDSEGSHPVDVKRFIRESELAKSLDHTGITKAYSIGTVGTIYYIVMEYVEGENLAEKIKKHGPLSEQDALQIFSKILDAFLFAWKKQVIHRDIKPENIIVDQENIKICDLGLAKMVNSNQLTQENIILGTPYYMSPEQCLGKQLDYRSDLYSLGVTLYTMLTGKLPYEGSYLDVVQGHISKPPIDPLVHGVLLSGPIAAFLSQLMDKVPANRCHNMTSLLKDINNVKKGKYPYSFKVLEVKKGVKKNTKRMVIAALFVIGVFIFSWGYKQIQYHRYVDKLNDLLIEKKYEQLLNKTKLYLVDYPHNVEIIQLRAVSHFYLGNYDSAEIDFFHLTRLHPENAEGFWGVAEVFYQKKYFEKSLEYINSALAIKQDFKYYFLKTRILYQQKEYSEAEEFAKKCIALQPKHWQSLYFLTLLSQQQDMWQRLILSLPENLDSQVVSWIYTLQGLFQLNNENIEDAISSLQQASANYSSELTDQLLIIAYTIQENYREAMIRIENISKNGWDEKIFFQYDLEKPKRLNEFPTLKHNSFEYSAAILFFYHSSYEKSLEYLNTVLVEQPSHKKALELRIQIYYKLSNYKSALGDLYVLTNKAEAKNDIKLYQLEMAYCYTELHQSNESNKILEILDKEGYNQEQVQLLQIKNLIHLELFEQATKKINIYTKSFPHNFEIYHLRGDIWSHKKLYDQAAKDYQKLLQHSPNEIVYQKLLNIFIGSKKYLRAIDVCNKILKLSSKNKNVILLTRGKSYLELGDYKKALNDFNNVEDKEIFFYQGITHFYLKDMNEAMKNFRQVLNQKDTLSPEIIGKTYHYLGIMFFEKKMYTNAQKAFTQSNQILQQGEIVESSNKYLEKMK